MPTMRMGVGFSRANIPGKPAEFNVYMGGADIFFKKCAEIAAGGFKSLHGQEDV